MKLIPYRVKKTVSTFYWKVLFLVSDLYDLIPFTKKWKRIKKFDQIAEDGKVYYTISMEEYGFTHILIRANFFLSLAEKMKMKYVYTPLKTNRKTEYKISEPEEVGVGNIDLKSRADQYNYNDIYDFTGVDDFLKDEGHEVSSEKFNKIELNPDEIEFSKSLGRSFDKLLTDIKSRLSVHLDPDKDNLVTIDNYTYVFRFYETDQIQRIRDGFFRRLYDQSREKNPWPSLFKDSKIKLLVHIRQGDTATIQTPWGCFIPTWYRHGEQRFKELKELNGYHSKIVIGVKEFYSFLRKLFNQLNEDRFSPIVFSDGFDRAFDEILNKKTDLDKKKRLALKQCKKNYNKEQFNDFYNWQQVKTVIGEEKEKFYSMIHSFLKSDIVITGTQQTMIPKLLSLYCNPENMPILIILHKIEPHSYEYLGIDQDYKKLVYVDLNNYDIKKVAAKLEEFLEN
ncbi:MAG: hypothetical protein JJU13_12755 [Balneolaceae bacterium]|nr:hypothetical protein [Balneolaceae bacterium]